MTRSPLLRLVDSLLELLIALLMAGLVLTVLWQVFTRFVLKDPSSYSEELARFLLIWLSFFGASYAAGHRLHLAIDLLPMSLTGRRRAGLDAAIQLVVILFSAAVLVYGGSRLSYIIGSLGQTSAALQVKLGYLYLAIPLNGLLIILYAAANLRQSLREWRASGSLAAE